MLKNYAKLANAAILFNLFGKRKLIKVGHRVTHRCNYSCSYCSIRKNPCRELSTDQILDLIDEIADFGCVVYAISGGEPLLRDDLPDILERVKQKDMVTKITTNGTLLKERIDEISSNVDQISVSLDTMQEEVPEEFGNIKRLDDKVIGGIKAAVDKGLNIGINMVMIKPVFNGLEELIKFTTKLGVRSFTFSIILTTFRYTTSKELAKKYEKMYEGLDTYKKAILKIKELKRRYPITMSDMMLDAYHSFKYPKMKCIAGFLSCDIYPDGSLATCQLRKEKTNSFKNRNFAELWNELGEQLNWVRECDGCILHCYFEPNAMFSFKLEPLLSYGKRYFPALRGK